jgi:UDP-N-acetylmuramyl tripeptide synthase
MEADKDSICYGKPLCSYTARINCLFDLIGLYNANNLNAAIAMESIFEVPNSMIKKALEEYVPENNRALKW